jgi:hypothetical protein
MDRDFKKLENEFHKRIKDMSFRLFSLIVDNFLNKIRLGIDHVGDYFMGGYFKKYMENPDTVDYKPIYDFIEDMNKVFRATTGVNFYFIDPYFLQKDRQVELINYLLSFEDKDLPFELPIEDQDVWWVESMLSLFTDMYMIHPDVYPMLVKFRDIMNWGFDQYEYHRCGWSGEDVLLGSEFWFSKMEYMSSMGLIYLCVHGEGMEHSYTPLIRLKDLYPKFLNSQQKYKKIMFVKKAYYKNVLKTKIPVHRGLCDDVLSLVWEYL